MDGLVGAVVAATRDHTRWIERIDAGLTAALAFLDREPQWAQALVLETPAAAAGTRKVTRGVEVALAPVLEQGRDEVIIGAQIRPSTELVAELVTLGVLSVVRSHMLRHDDVALVELAPSLMSFVLLPYLGRAADKADLPDGSPQRLQARPEMVPIRLHPRTMRVLEVIAASPGLSNRQISNAVGVEKPRKHVWGLLKRLQQRGLIEDTRPINRPGQPNAWLITPYGRRIQQVLADAHAIPARGQRRQSAGAIA